MAAAEIPNKITAEIHALFTKRLKILEKLVDKTVAPETGLYPVMVNGECIGMRIGEKNVAVGGSIAVIAGTHNNETAGFDTAGILMDNALKILEKLREKREDEKAKGNKGTGIGDIYILHGGHLPSIRAFFEKVKMTPEGESIDPTDLETYRNVRDFDKDGKLKPLVNKKNSIEINGNRIPKALVENAPPLLRWLYGKFRGIQQEIYQHCKDVVDIHSFSRAGKPALLFVENKLPLEVVARMGIEKVLDLFPPERDLRPVDFMAQFKPDGNYQGSVPHPRRYTMGIEAGQHFDSGAGNIATNAVRALILERWGIDVADIIPEITVVDPKENGAVFSEAKGLYIPGSLYANLNPEGFNPSMKGEYEGYTLDKKLYFITDDTKLPDDVKALYDKELSEGKPPIKLNQLENGEGIEKGQPIAYMYARKEEDCEPFILRSPVDGHSFMVAQKGYADDDNTFIDIPTKVEPYVMVGNTAILPVNRSISSRSSGLL